jgi:hypothetical protein
MISNQLALKQYCHGTFNILSEFCCVISQCIDCFAQNSFAVQFAPE